MSVHIDMQPDFPASTLLNWMCCECRNLIDLDFDDDRQEVPREEAIVDCISGLRVKVAGQWFRLRVTAEPTPEPSPEDLATHEHCHARRT